MGLYCNCTVRADQPRNQCKAASVPRVPNAEKTDVFERAPPKTAIAKAFDYTHPCQIGGRIEGWLGTPIRLSLLPDALPVFPPARASGSA
jgi:hypothetical protein